jgi:hypothetical protein
MLSMFFLYSSSSFITPEPVILELAILGPSLSLRDAAIPWTLREGKGILSTSRDQGKMGVYNKARYTTHESVGR